MMSSKAGPAGERMLWFEVRGSSQRMAEAAEKSRRVAVSQRGVVRDGWDWDGIFGCDYGSGLRCISGTMGCIVWV